MYMGSIATTICSNNFYNLCSSLLSYDLFLYNFFFYNEKNNTIHTRELSWVFPPTTLSYLIELNLYNYFTLITLNDYNRHMRVNAQDLHYNPKDIKLKYIFLDITLMFHPLKFKILSKCALVYIQLSSTRTCW